ncbi:hypothetical protein ACFL58_00665 [Elusimicrobiota bacterium]
MIILSFLIFYLYQFQYIPKQKKIISAISIEKSKTIFDVSIDQINQAIKNTDDLSLISHIENIAKISDVSNVYIIDTNGKVLTHNNTAEWGKIYDDSLSKKAAETKKYYMQYVKDEKAYLFSRPVNSTYTLCINLSSEKISKEAYRMKIAYFYASLLILLVTGFIFALLMHHVVILPLIKIENSIESALLSKNGKLSVDKNRDFEELVALINKILSESGGTDNKHSQSGVDSLISIFQEATKHFNKGIAIFNFDNRIISANEKALKFLSLNQNDIKGKTLHILDINAPSEFLSLFKTAASSPFKTHNETINGNGIEIIAVENKEKTIAGTILIVN